MLSRPSLYQQLQMLLTWELLILWLAGHNGARELTLGAARSSWACQAHMLRSGS